jgi:single-strand DNA-binding protein
MSLNKVLLLGRLGKDPEIRYTNQQNPIGNFSLATSERRKDASGNWNEVTEWHNIVVFGKTAENCSKFLKKGREAFIEGRIQTRKWQDKEGKDRYTTEVIANTVQFVGGRGASDGDSNDGYSQSSAPTRGKLPQSLMAADNLESGPTEITFDDDDIPF